MQRVNLLDCHKAKMVGGNCSWRGHVSNVGMESFSKISADVRVGHHVTQPWISIGSWEASYWLVQCSKSSPSQLLEITKLPLKTLVLAGEPTMGNGWLKIGAL